MVSDGKVFSRRALLAGAAAFASTPVLARAPARSLFPHPRPNDAPRLAALAPAARPALLSATLSEVLAQSGLSGSTAVIALDARTGAVIESHRPDLRLPPASTAKAVTALYAANTLGLGHRFVTRVLARGGSIQNGVLNGDLVLRGGGDPVLQTEDLARLADELLQRGLRRVDGRFIVEHGALPTLSHIDRSQPDQAGYNPGLSGINLNFNRVHFGWEVRNGRAALTLDARSEREQPPVSMIEIRAVSRDLPVYSYRESGGIERWSVAASALGRSGSRWLPVRQPAQYAGDVFRALLRARGCQVPQARIARSGQGGAVLAEHYSAPLNSVLRGMLRYSTNLTAECVGLSASARAGASVRSLSASAQSMNRWAAQAHGADGLDFEDHSGLDDGSRISPRAQAQFMRSALREGSLPTLLRDHAMRDEDGRPIRNHPISVQAKTGTLNFVSALSGYAQRQGGSQIVFSILSADLDRRRAIRDADGERPRGTRSWNRRARALQQSLIERWTAGQA